MLTTVLIITAILLFGGMTVLISSMDLSKISKDTLNNSLNNLRANSCVEEGLNKLKWNNYFIGSASIPYPDGGCTVNISLDKTDNNFRIFSIESTLDDYKFTLTKKVDISQSPFLIVN